MKTVFFSKEFLNKNIKDHIIFICDHATNFIPSNYNNLGISDENLKSHIAYDIGAKEVTEHLAKKLGQSYFLSNFSRLLIDPNRNINDIDLIKSNSFGIDIPGNFNIKINERKKRIDCFYNSYHKNLTNFIKDKLKKFSKVSLVAVHSFTKRHKNFDRGIEVGLLWNKNMNLLLPIQEGLKKQKIHFGRNYPYPGFYYNYTLDKLSKKKLNNICIEIRNDLICSEKGIKKYVEIFSNIFKGFLND